MRRFLIPIALVIVLLGPILLRQRDGALDGAQDTLVVITPHHESIRYEIGRAFERHYQNKTGRTMRVDYRTPGGTSEIGRYAAGEFEASFENHWRRVLGQPWSKEVQLAFANGKQSVTGDSPAARARKAFLDSNVGCKLDVFFGGGAFDYARFASAGYLVDSGMLQARPDLFNAQVIPQTRGGEPFWDKDGRWVAPVISAFGIVANRDALRRVGVTEPPTRWAQLAEPAYFGQVALCNPTQSSSVNKAFEMLIQQQMHETVAQQGTVAEGWTRAMRMLQRIGANARYFTDTSTKIALDVSGGDCAAGMTIDFYGRYQSEAMRQADGTSPVVYTDAVGGTSVGVDPVAIFRGAPHEAAAREFLAFLFTEEAQKLWNWKVGTPGGPERFALRRLAILPSMYAEEYRAFRSDPDVAPYANQFAYEEKWTSSLFIASALIFRCMCIDTHDELREAWHALIQHNFPPMALERFQDVSAVGYEVANGSIKKASDRGAKKIDEVTLARTLADGFRKQYREAAELAKQGR